ncbi:MAG TPA: sodium:proton antiporter [Candidatus Acidoferrum sp.]|jgi:multicomponent Na+:H+ antiporter subunit C|nr:sodium:proton antiporter [Candidatus Acidoferrum sp.]
MIAHLPFAVAAWVFIVGFYGMATSRNLIHLILCLSVTQSATYVLILMVGYRLGATAPIFSDVLPGVRATDPVVQALTLTDIVVGATVTALLLTFALRIFKKCGTLDPQALRSMRG